MVCLSVSLVLGASGPEPHTISFWVELRGRERGRERGRGKPVCTGFNIALVSLWVSFLVVSLRLFDLCASFVGFGVILGVHERFTRVFWLLFHWCLSVVALAGSRWLLFHLPSVFPVLLVSFALKGLCRSFSSFISFFF